MENQKSPGERKIDEYIDRINAGESADSILDGLSDSMQGVIKERLSQQTKTDENDKAQEIEVIIPSSLRDQPADVLEEMWQLTLHSDPEIAAKQIQERQRIIDKRRYEEAQEKILFEERQAADTVKIGEIRERLGIDTAGSSDQRLQDQLEGIKNVMDSIARGAREGLKDSFEVNVARYVDNIKSGQPKEKVLEGLPPTMIKEVERRLGESSEPQIEQTDLSKAEIENLLKTLPRVPVAEGSPMKTIDPAVLKSRGKLELNPGDKIYTMGPNGPVIAEVLSKGDIGQITLRLEDGTTFPTTFLGDTYLLSDIDKLKNPELIDNNTDNETTENNLEENLSRFDLKISELEQAIKLYSSLAHRLSASDEKMTTALRDLSDKISETMTSFDVIDKMVNFKPDNKNKIGFENNKKYLLDKDRKFSDLIKTSINSTSISQSAKSLADSARMLFNILNLSKESI